MSEKDDEQAGFDDAGLDDDAAGFNSIDGADAPTETPEQDAKTEQPAVVEQPAVEYVQLTRAEVEELKSRAALIDEIRTTQDKSFGTFGRTIKGMQERLQEIAAGPQVEIAQDDIDLLRDDFPPLAAALEKVRNLRALPGAGAMTPEARAELVQEATRQLHMEMLEADHDDWRDVGATQEWAAWKAAQPAAVQQKLDSSWNSRFLSQQFTAFKQSRAKPSQAAANPATPTRTSRMQAAITPRGSGGAHATADSISEQAGFDSVQ